eukprot:scaffold16055_cov22-Tisochrysis_lutea.AAC.2
MTYVRGLLQCSSWTAPWVKAGPGRPLIRTTRMPVEVNRGTFGRPLMHAMDACATVRMSTHACTVEGLPKFLVAPQSRADVHGDTLGGQAD